MVVAQRPGAVELLQQQHTRQGMRQGHVRQANGLVGRLLERRINAIGTADDERHIAAIVQPRFGSLGQLHAGQARTTFIKDDAAHAPVDGRFHAGRFGLHDDGHGLALTGFGLEGLDLHLPVGREALEVVLARFVGPVRQAVANGDHRQLHQRAVFLAGAFLAATFLAATFFTATVLTAAFLAATFLTATLRAGVFFSGALMTIFFTFAAVLVATFLAATFFTATVLLATFLAATGLADAVLLVEAVRVVVLLATFVAATFLEATFFVATGLAAVTFFAAAFLAAGAVVAALRAGVVLPAAFLGLAGASSSGSDAFTRPALALVLIATGLSPQISSSW